MLDESMFEDIHEIAENSAYLKAVEEKDVSLEMLEQLPAYDDLRELEDGLRAQKQLTFQNIFQEPTGYYMIKCFLIADYAVDKAIFIKDVEAYKSMRFESARRKIAKLLYQRFVSPDGDAEHKFPKGSSVFSLIRQERQTDGAADEKSQQQALANGNGGAGGLDSKMQITANPNSAAAGAGANANATLQPGSAAYPNGGTPTAGNNNNITVPGATNASANGSTNGSTPQPPAANNNPNQQPANGSPAQQTRAAGGSIGGAGDIAMTKLSSADKKSNQGDTLTAKDTLHKPSGSADTLSALTGDKNGGPNAALVTAAAGGDGAKPSDALQQPGAMGSPTQPGRSSHTAITMNITTGMSGANAMNATGGAAGPGTAPNTAGSHGTTFDKEQEKTVISQNHTTMHSHNGPHSATSVVVGARAGGTVLGAGLGSTSTATGAGAGGVGTALGGERVEFQIGNTNNAIGVYGKIVKRVKDRVGKGEAPKDLFDEVAQQVMNDLKLDVFPRFKQSEFYKKYIRTKSIETMKVSIKDFTTFRVLGRGGFGAVHACRKTNSGTLYAMKCINKKLVKVKSALDNVLEERNVLTMMKSNFVTNLKYALQDDETLYLIMDLMLGGDLKFHLINAGRFTEKRARFYAAEVLLGLEHVHNASIIYRDMKLENVLLDHLGHCRISDLGLAVVTKTKIKGYAGTPGYTAPEMIKNKLYGPSADIFSFGVMLYRMLCGSKPFKGKIDRDLDKAVVDRKPQFPKEIFSKDAISLLTGLLHKRPENRLGCQEKGIEEIKDHPFFESIDWGLLEAGYLDPPFVPNKFDVNAASLKDIGDFDKTKYKNVKLDERFRARVKNFHFVSIRALQDEMVAVLEKADENVNFEKFAPTHPELKTAPATQVAKCCTIL